MVEKPQGAGMWPQMFEPFRNFGRSVSEWLSPASEASADGKSYKITVELPGVEEKDVEITVNAGLLSVKGEKRTEREEKGETWYFSERQYGAFSRSFRLPADADEDAVKADLKDGILTIIVPQRSGTDKDGARKVAIGKS